MTQLLRATPKGPNLIPCTQVGWLTAICNSNPKESAPSSGLLRHCTHHTNTHIYTHSHTLFYIHSHTHTLTNTHTLLQTLTRTYIIHTHIYTLSYTHSHVHTHSHIHTHTHMHTFEKYNLWFYKPGTV